MAPLGRLLPTQRRHCIGKPPAPRTPGVTEGTRVADRTASMAHAAATEAPHAPPKSHGTQAAAPPHARGSHAAPTPRCALLCAAKVTRHPGRCAAHVRNGPL